MCLLLLLYVFVDTVLRRGGVHTALCFCRYYVMFLDILRYVFGGDLVAKPCEETLSPCMSF